MDFYKKSALFNNREDIGSNPFGHVKSVHSLSAKNIFIVIFKNVIKTFFIDGFDVFLALMTYSMIAAIFVLIIEEEGKEKDNILGRAFIWPILLLIAMVKAVRSVYLETKAEMEDWTKTINKK